jgi:DNA-directed RNA polymerase beta subunit
MKQWYSLTHHVTSHQRTVTIIMLQEWNQTCGYRSNLLWRDVNIINLIRTYNRIISILTTLYYITNERTINSQRRITLTDNLRLFNTLAKDPSNSEKEAVNYIYRQLRNADPADDASAREVFQNLFFSDKRYDLGEVGRYRINKKLNLDTDIDVRVLTKEDIIEIIKYLIQLINSSATVDDIDHLSNRRVRTVGEQLANQFSIGLARMTRTIRERMNVRDNEVFTPTDLINAKTISSVINSFFGTNPLSQFMDQTNPLAEVTHKRRLSALGPGGLSRERAGFEVRDVHYTHLIFLMSARKLLRILMIMVSYVLVQELNQVIS